MQPGLWGEAGERARRAHRAMHRVQGMLGPDAVVTGVLGGGRDPGAQVTLGAVGRRVRAGACPDGAVAGPAAAPSPATVLRRTGAGRGAGRGRRHRCV